MAILWGNSNHHMSIQMIAHISSWLQGNEPAFKLVFDHYYPRLYKYAVRYVKDETTAEDITMQVLARIWEKKHLVKEAETFENYLFTIARNQIIQSWKQQVEGWVSIEHIQDSPVATTQTDVLLTRELEDIYHKSLSALPEQRRRIFLLHRNDKLTYKQIAQQLDISPKTVENQVGVALKHLRAAMMNYLSSLLL
ncbi:RNA polymerase sigma-70 factor [Chitinophaga pendula]|uniref:RNA polymerase sigma-70 factor n=1 Tax=Chitinophaga TaxID=79328 RepID=UPI0012FE7304|nr:MULTISPECIES: RNA polymerase sigma-70 factor [Chitinophaga]UCJ08964.1 RNA polymerase sigma-70 factor [Chitinophaga pendula]